MAAVVHARRELVHDERAVPQQEELDRQRSDKIALHRQAGSQRLCLTRDLGRDRRRRRDDALDEDALVVKIASDGKCDRDSVGPAGDDRRQLAIEIQLALENEPSGLRRELEVCPCSIQIVWTRDSNLAPPVIPAERCLEA